MMCILTGHREVTQHGSGDTAGITSTFCVNCGKVFSVGGDPAAIQRRAEQAAKQRGGYEAVRERMA